MTNAQLRTSRFEDQVEVCMCGEEVEEEKDLLDVSKAHNTMQREGFVEENAEIIWCRRLIC